MGRGIDVGTSVPLGHLTVGEKLGEGGFGVVHEANLAGIETAFAIKFLDPHPANEDADGAKRRFLREANVLFQLRHPIITPIYGVGEHEGRPYIIMERFAGHNLYQARAKFGQPEPMLVLPFIELVTDALMYAHNKKVVHRDIKPTNLMTVKGDARVLDFGLAALVDPDGERFTRSASAVGGDVYSAPELTDNPRLIDPRCDLFSLGACWFWLLTGTPPKGRNWEANLRAAVKVPRAYEDVLLRCLEQPARRYTTAGELLADVRALRAGQSPAVSPHDITDDHARLLGIIVAGCPTALHSLSLYRIEQELGGSLSRLRTSLALHALVKRGFVSEDEEVENFETFKVFKPTVEGREWAERNLTRIEDLERAAAAVVLPAVSTPDAEIPF
jgi:serine/threonine protein kinase